jgi:hypothetical protein
MDFRARSPNTTPKYPLHRGQIRAIFRAISHFLISLEKLGGSFTLYTTMRQEKDPHLIWGRAAQEFNLAKTKGFPTNGFRGLWVSKYSAQTAKAPVLICRNDASKGF